MYPNLQATTKKGLTQWLNRVNLDEFYTESKDICLELNIWYEINKESDWNDLTIGIFNWATYNTVNINFESGRIVEISEFKNKLAC